MSHVDFLSETQDNFCLKAVESVKEHESFFDSIDDEICVRAAENVTEAEMFMSPSGDELCVLALERMEYKSMLNDGNDNSIMQADSEVTQTVSNGTSVVEVRILNIMSSNYLAKAYIDNMFYSFASWPTYMKEVFVLTHIMHYNYATRNKICLFFWGNGATCEIMFNLSFFFGPQINIRNYEDAKADERSRKKCVGLFKTYSKELHNPQYNQRYYYFNIHIGCMLYIDGTPRRNGRRTNEIPRIPRWV